MSIRYYPTERRVHAYGVLGYNPLDSEKMLGRYLEEIIDLGYNVKFISKDLEYEAMRKLINKMDGKLVGFSTCGVVREDVFFISVTIGSDIFQIHIKITTIDETRSGDSYVMPFVGELYTPDNVILDSDYNKEISDSLYPAKVELLFKILNIPSEKYFKKIEHPDPKPAWLKK